MQENSVVATLHHQIVYRIQDHALDLVLPSTDEALYLEVTSASQAPSSTQIPRQISREELIKKLPESWVTSYEKLHQAAQTPVQTSEVSFHSRLDGTTEIKFERPRSSSFRKQLFTQFALQIDEHEFYGPYQEQNPKPISFGQYGQVVYPFKDENGHQYFDVCNCTACTESSYESDDEIRQRRRKKKDPLYKRYLEGDPTVGPLGEGNGRYEYIVQYSEKKEDSTRQEIMMMKADDFPPPEDFVKNNIAHSPKILSKAVHSSGPDQLSQAEKVLNWQSENAIVQNQLLTTINRKLDLFSDGQNKRLSVLQGSISEIHSRLNGLHHEMMSMAKNMMVNTSQFRSKEAEMADLKIQLKDLQRCLESMIQNRHSSDAYSPQFGSWSSSMPIYQGSYSPGFLSGDQYQKKKNPIPGFLSSDEAFTSRFGITPTNIFKPRPTRDRTRRYKESEFLVNPTKKPTITPSQSSQESLENKEDKGEEIGIIEFSMPNLLLDMAKDEKNPKSSPQEVQPTSSQPTPTINHYSDSSSSDYNNNSEDESLPKQFAIGEGSSIPKEEPNINEVYSSDEEMHDNTFQQQETPPKQFASKVVTFTFDDIPFQKWNDRLDEFHAWMNSEVLTSPTHLVIQHFTARLMGALKEWWNSLGEYRQQQVYQTTIPLLLGEIHREFIGTPSHLKEQLQEEKGSGKTLRAPDTEILCA